MPFSSPSWVPSLPYDPPDSIPINEFILDDAYRASPIAQSHNPFTCGITGRTYSALHVSQRVTHLSRALSQELDFQPNRGCDLDKVIGLFCVNSIDTLTLAWATHRLGGVQSPANAAYSADELAYQLKDSGAKALFTCRTLLETALAAAEKIGLSRSRVFLLQTGLDNYCRDGDKDFTTVDQLIDRGRSMTDLEKLQWSKGEGARRIAFLCYSSGTSGLPKGVMISHRNVIANVMQLAIFKAQPEAENVLALVPLSHIYGLVFVAHLSALRGDTAIVLPKFDFKTYLAAIQRFSIHDLYIVPPIMILMAKSKPLMDTYDLSSVRTITTGAAPLGAETASDLSTQYPRWKILQGYGLTETSPVVCNTAAHDVMHGSSGSLLPGTQMRLMSSDGVEITEYDQPGEIWVSGPSVTLGYLHNEKATSEAYINGWLRTGDEGLVRRHPDSGHEHIFIVDRLKELIKVNGLQVAPAELEAHLLTHPAVDDCVVIGVPSDREGEVPKAFVVKAAGTSLEVSDLMLKREIARHVQKHKAKHKWLKGGVEFVESVPKSPSGKVWLYVGCGQHMLIPMQILRRLVRDKEREMRRKTGSKL